MTYCVQAEEETGFLFLQTRAHACVKENGIVFWGVNWEDQYMFIRLLGFPLYLLMYDLQYKAPGGDCCCDLVLNEREVC